MARSTPTYWPSTSRHERGYGAQWDRTRARILERDHYQCQCPQCTEADARGERRLRATHVDHKISREKARALGWTTEQMEADDNLQAMNEDCHKRKTQEERGKTYTPKKVIGVDGFPLEGSAS